VSVRRVALTLAVVGFALLGSATARAEDDPIVGFWNVSGGVVQVTGSGSSFTGTIVKPTRLSDCTHPVGEAMWKIAKSGTGYTGTHTWFAAGNCTPGSLGLGSSTWTISESGSTLVLHFCTTSPADSSDTRCSDLTRAKPVAPGPVPIATVSNGCGGAGWASLVAVQNYLGNTSVYKNSNINPLAKSYTVSFKDACDLHDAGYSGAIVADKLRGGIKDFRKWTRKQVDDKFLADMRFLCRQAIPPTAAVALKNCQGRGGNLSFGAESRFNFVRKWGYLFFDADLSQAGTQRTGPRSNA
jgi:hypothetical protein